MAPAWLFVTNLSTNRLLFSCPDDMLPLGLLLLTVFDYHYFSLLYFSLVLSSLAAAFSLLHNVNRIIYVYYIYIIRIYIYIWLIRKFQLLVVVIIIELVLNKSHGCSR